MTDVLRIFAPILLWLALFSGVYGLHGIGCGLGWAEVALAGPASLHRVALLMAYAGALAAGALMLVLITGRWRSPRPFARRVSRDLAVAALVAIGWTLAPVLYASSCG